MTAEKNDSQGEWPESAVTRQDRGVSLKPLPLPALKKGECALLVNEENGRRLCTYPLNSSRYLNESRVTEREATASGPSKDALPET